MWSPTRSMISQLCARHVTSVSITSKLYTHHVVDLTDPCITTFHHFVLHHINIVTQASYNFKLLWTLHVMFHISSSCDHQQDPWSYNFMRVMSRVFRFHQNFEHIVVVDLRSLHLITSSLRLASHHVVTQASWNLLRRQKNFTRISIVDRFNFFKLLKL